MGEVWWQQQQEILELVIFQGERMIHMLILANDKSRQYNKKCGCIKEFGCMNSNISKAKKNIILFIYHTSCFGSASFKNYFKEHWLEPLSQSMLFQWIYLVFFCLLFRAQFSASSYTSLKSKCMDIWVLLTRTTDSLLFI